MVRRMKIGETDKWGYTLLNRKGPVTLFRTPKGYYIIYLAVDEDKDEYLTVVRKNLNEANKLYYGICHMF